MSCFLLPQGIIKKIQSAISNFWWSNKHDNRGLHWIAWDKICVPLEKGGLGFRDLKNFNLALLAKQLWRLIDFPSSLLARVLKGRYYRNTSQLEVERSNNPSYGWSSIMAAKELLCLGLRKSIGTGENTRVWTDHWIPCIPPRPLLDCGMYQDPLLLVADLIDPRSKEWRLDKMTDIMDLEDITLALRLKPSQTKRTDGFCWAYTKSGQYTVKSGYELAMERKNSLAPQQFIQPSTDLLKNKIWSEKAPRKIKHFIWQALNGCVSVRSRLVDRHCGSDRSCPRCGDTNETINHLLFECPSAIHIWTLANLPFILGSFPSSALFTNLDHLMWHAKESGVPEKTLVVFPWILWYIWKARNDKVFNGKDVSPLVFFSLARAETDAWMTAQIVAEALDEEPTSTGTNTQTREVVFPRCQVDASWTHDDTVFGTGLALDIKENITITGLGASAQVISPLHAELGALTWAMKEIRQMRLASMRFETDSLQLVKLIENDEDWPSLASEFEDFYLIRDTFSSFILSFIPRTQNVRADALSKEARARGQSFSHVQSLPSLVASRATRFVPL